MGHLKINSCMSARIFVLITASNYFSEIYSIVTKNREFPQLELKLAPHLPFPRKWAPRRAGIGNKDRFNSHALCERSAEICLRFKVGIGFRLGSTKLIPGTRVEVQPNNDSS